MSDFANSGVGHTGNDKSFSKEVKPILETIWKLEMQLRRATWAASNTFYNHVVKDTVNLVEAGQDNGCGVDFLTEVKRKLLLPPCSNEAIVGRKRKSMS